MMSLGLVLVMGLVVRTLSGKCLMDSLFEIAIKKKNSLFKLRISGMNLCFMDART